MLTCQLECVELFLTGIIIILLSYRWYKKNHNLPPGPWNLPVLGYLPWIDPKKPHFTLTKLSEKYGPIYGLYFGNIYTVVISDVDLMKKILIKDVASGRAPLFLINKIINGKGLIFAQHDLWKNQRKFIQNFLRRSGASKVSQNRKQLEDKIMNSVLDFIQYMKSKGDHRIIVNPSEILIHYVGNIVSHMVLGRTWTREDKLWKHLLHLMDEGAKLIGIAGPINFLPFLIFLPKFQKIVHFLHEATDSTHSVYKKIIDEKNWLSDDNSTLNLIQAFLKERSKHKSTEDGEKFYSDQQLNFLLSDIFGASLDTTLSSLSWYFLYMAIYQDVQNKVRQELSDNLYGKQPTLEDLAILPYTEASIAEVQRIRTVVPLGVPHGILDEMQVENFKLPRHTMIIPLLWAIHMDPKVWGDPENFRPERFINENGKFYKPKSFVPFETGKRMCVGEELAKMNLFLFSSTIVQNFGIHCEDSSKMDLTGICGLALTPKPHKLIFTKL